MCTNNKRQIIFKILDITFIICTLSISRGFSSRRTDGNCNLPTCIHQISINSIQVSFLSL